MFRLVIQDLEQYQKKTSCSGRAVVLYFISHRYLPVLIYRISRWLFEIRLKPVSYVVFLVNYYLCRVEISPKVKIDGGLILPHPMNVVIGAHSVGRNCTIFQNVTLGAVKFDVEFSSESRPIIGNNVTFYANSGAFGNINVPDHTIVKFGSIINE